MLGIMRKYKQSILIKVVFGVIVLSFIGTIFLVWGRGDKGTGPSDYAAKVNGTKISLESFQRSYYRTRGIYEQLYGRSLTPEMEKQMGIKKLTIDSLIDNELVREAADDMGIKVNKKEIQAAIEGIPAFQKDGAFNFELYKQTLKANRLTPRAFEDATEEEILVNKTRDKIKESAKLTDQELLQAYKKQNDKVDLQYVSFSPADVRGEVKLSDQELNSYLQSHEAEFKTPEEVSISYTVVSPAKVASGAAVTEEEAQTFYQKNIDRYQGKGGILPYAEVKEQVKADAQKQKAAKEAYEKAADTVNKFKGNADIAAAAAALGSTVEKTALFTAQAPPPALAGEADVVKRAFMLKQGDLGGPVETPKGIYLVKVLEKRPPAVPPLAQIRDAVAKKATDAKAAELAQKKAQEAAAAFAKGNVAGAKETGNFGYAATGAIPQIGTSPALMEEAFSLTAAAPAAKEPYKIGDRWFAVKLKGRVEAPTTDFPVKKEALKKELLPKKQQEAVEKWLKELRAKAKIQINPAIVAE
ncbi:SurA N-terminal domain-containing protein [Geomonas sp. RF6]|uniref:peptidylprolyl isomerase n=1 Tax=Geomonas sp. RF6 TaxID=2897342 RepID=UPI001E3F2D31|nr:peptidylprolyl isomerase [Geomonas sp. RF6]UFS71226.1 SurA N-terminal domain-containing protein [Geomonas sp. RF6]